MLSCSRPVCQCLTVYNNQLAQQEVDRPDSRLSSLESKTWRQSLVNSMLNKEWLSTPAHVSHETQTIHGKGMTLAEALAAQQSLKGQSPPSDGGAVNLPVPSHPTRWSGQGNHKLHPKDEINLFSNFQSPWVGELEKELTASSNVSWISVRTEK